MTCIMRGFSYIFFTFSLVTKYWDKDAFEYRHALNSIIPTSKNVCSPRIQNYVARMSRLRWCQWRCGVSYAVQVKLIMQVQPAHYGTLLIRIFLLNILLYLTNVDKLSFLERHTMLHCKCQTTRGRSCKCAIVQA